MTKVIFLSSISQSTGIEFLIIRMLKVNTFLRKLEVIKGLLDMTDNLPFERFVDAPNWSTKSWQRFFWKLFPVLCTVCILKFNGYIRGAVHCVFVLWRSQLQAENERLCMNYGLCRAKGINVKLILFPKGNWRALILIQSNWSLNLQGGQDQKIPTTWTSNTTFVWFVGAIIATWGRILSLTTTGDIFQWSWKIITLMMFCSCALSVIDCPHFMMTSYGENWP